MDNAVFRKCSVRGGDPHEVPLLTPGNLQRPESKEIPMDYIRKWITTRMPEMGTTKPSSMGNRILVIQSKTGTGKSLTIPVYLFRDIYRGRSAQTGSRYTGPSIVCTQPRVLTAIDIARRVATKFSDLEMGKTVGYQTGPMNNKPVSGLIYATMGVLATQLMIFDDTDIMEMYGIIIIDEAHERSLDGDLLIMALKAFYKRNEGNPKMPFLILMSATIDVFKYAEFFGLGTDNIVEVRGVSHEIRQHFMDHGTNDYISTAVETALKIHEENIDDLNRGDILIFVPSFSKMLGTAVLSRLNAANDKYFEPGAKHPPFITIKLSGDIVKDETGDYVAATAPLSALTVSRGGVKMTPSRKIIVSTNVAETGITIDSLKYVIDSGWEKKVEIYAPSGATGLITKPITRDSSDQRKGRAGRLFPGEYYPLFTSGIRAALIEHSHPDIVLAGCDNIILKIIASQQRSKIARGVVPEFLVDDIDMLDMPPASALSSAIEKAILLGFVSDNAILDDTFVAHPDHLLKIEMVENADDLERLGKLKRLTRRGYGLTRIGLYASRMHDISMEAARLVFSSYARGASTGDMLTLAAMTELGQSFVPYLSANVGSDTPKDFTAVIRCLPEFITGLAQSDFHVKPMVPADSSADSPADSSAGSPAATRRKAPAVGIKFKEAYFRASLLLNDGMATMILVFDRFMRETEKRPRPHEMADWCAQNGLDFTMMVSLAGMRSAIANAFISLGLNPFWGCGYALSKSVNTQDEFFGALKKIKMCIYDAFRVNILQYKEDRDHYESRHGHKVKVVNTLTSGFLSDVLKKHAMPSPDKPRRIVTNFISIQQSMSYVRKNGVLRMYELRAGFVSTLDGYVPTDESYTDPRDE